MSDREEIADLILGIIFGTGVGSCVIGLAPVHFDTKTGQPRLDEAFTEFLTASDKTESYQNLLRMLGVPEGAEDPIKAKAVLDDGLLKWPKNWRSFNHLQTVARLQLSKNGEYALNKVPVSSKAFFEMIGIERLPGARILDLGCGSLDPLLQAIYLVCNGAGHITAIDVDQCSSPERSAYAMADLLAEIMLNPAKWCAGAISPDEVRNRASLFDIDALRQGKMLEGIANAPVRYAVGQVQELCSEKDSIDIVMSFSVIEHIMDPVAVLRHVEKILAPGGALVSQVDFSDHRQFSRPGHTFWTFMTNGGAEQPGINQFRISEIFKIIEDSGLPIAQSKPMRKELPPEVRHNLKPRFAMMSDEDLETVQTFFCAFKPGDFKVNAAVTHRAPPRNLPSFAKMQIRRFGKHLRRGRF